MKTKTPQAEAGAVAQEQRADPGGNAAQADSAAETGKAMTMADVEAMITRLVLPIAQSVQALGEAQKSSQGANSRKEFIGEKMADLPEVYRNLMPQTADAAELARAEQTVRERFTADMKASGLKFPNKGGAPVSQSPTVAKPSATTLIEQGLQESMKTREEATGTPAQ